MAEDKTDALEGSDIVQDPASGKAYLYMDADHRGVLCLEMAEDMISAEKKVSEQYMGLIPPFTREGIALFEREGRKYMLTSGMTGYIPNQSDSAVSEAWDAPFFSKGDPYVDDESMSSFNSQFTQIFKLPDRNIYIALSDRWVPDYPVDLKRADMLRRCVASRYDPKNYQATEEEQAELAAAPMLETVENSHFRMTVDPLGARITSLFSKDAGVDLTVPGSPGLFTESSWDRWHSRGRLAKTVFDVKCKMEENGGELTIVEY